jgi:hypothetical protein
MLHFFVTSIVQGGGVDGGHDSSSPGCFRTLGAPGEVHMVESRITPVFQNYERTR